MYINIDDILYILIEIDVFVHGTKNKEIVFYLFCIFGFYLFLSFSLYLPCAVSFANGVL